MSGELVVDTEAMRAHARALAPVAAGLREAKDAVVSTALPDSSFGLLCAFLVPPATALQGSAAVGVVAGAAAVAGTGAAVGASADAYDAVDEAVRTTLDAFKELLP